MATFLEQCARQFSLPKIEAVCAGRSSAGVRGCCLAQRKVFLMRWLAILLLCGRSSQLPQSFECRSGVRCVVQPTVLISRSKWQHVRSGTCMCRARYPTPRHHMLLLRRKPGCVGKVGDAGCSSGSAAEGDGFMGSTAERSGSALV